ncbi:hypothetical protein CGRA01v4_11802 [Colletotrichum graminicola]|nr:hypothetical protein CGRA01v4_11802 [Colletotrichum graminicola]
MRLKRHVFGEPPSFSNVHPGTHALSVSDTQARTRRNTVERSTAQPEPWRKPGLARVSCHLGIQARPKFRNPGRGQSSWCGTSAFPWCLSAGGPRPARSNRFPKAPLAKLPPAPETDASIFGLPTAVPFGPGTLQPLPAPEWRRQKCASKVCMPRD